MYRLLHRAPSVTSLHRGCAWCHIDSPSNAVPAFHTAPEEDITWKTVSPVPVTDMVMHFHAAVLDSDSLTSIMSEKWQSQIRREGKRRKVRINCVHNRSPTVGTSSGYDLLRFRYETTELRGQPDNHIKIEATVRRFVTRALRGERGLGEEAGVYLASAHKVIGVDAFSAQMSLRMFARNALVRETEVLAKSLIQSGLLQREEVFDSLLKAYSRAGDVEKVALSFDKMERLSIPRMPYQYADVIAGFGKAKDEAAAFSVFKRMREVDGVTADFTTCLALLVSCQSLQKGFKVVTMMRSMGLHSRSAAVYTALAALAVRVYRFEVALRVLHAATVDEACDGVDAVFLDVVLKCLSVMAKYARQHDRHTLQRLCLFQVLLFFKDFIIPMEQRDNRPIMKSSLSVLQCSCYSLSTKRGDIFDKIRCEAQRLFTT